MPPTGHFAVAAPVTAASCAVCHPDAVNADGTINLHGQGAHERQARREQHGLQQLPRRREPQAQPRRHRRQPDLGAPGRAARRPGLRGGRAPGAHEPHGGELPDGPHRLRRVPRRCPTDAAHATNPPAAVVVFGTLSKTGGAAPTFNATHRRLLGHLLPRQLHLRRGQGLERRRRSGPTTTPLTCTSCHGMLPTGHPTYTGTITAASCFQCHPQSVNADGTIKQGGGHVNGKADGGGCTACHGDPPTTGKHTISDHRNLRCDKCHPTGYTSAATVAPFHNNGKTDLGTPGRLQVQQRRVARRVPDRTDADLRQQLPRQRRSGSRPDAGRRAAPIPGRGASPAPGRGTRPPRPPGRSRRRCARPTR